jgi:hypothetical protein
MLIASVSHWPDAKERMMSVLYGGAIFFFVAATFWSAWFRREKAPVRVAVRAKRQR